MIRRAWLLAFALACLTQAGGQIINSYQFTAAGGGTLAFDAGSINDPPVTTTSVTTSHTQGALTNGLVVIFVAHYDTDDAQTPSSVTYDGTGATLHYTETDTGFGGLIRVQIYYLAVGTKSSGSYNAVANFSSTTDDAYVGVMTFNHAAQSSPLRTGTGAESSSTSDSISVTSADGDIVVSGAFGYPNSDPNSFSVNGSETEAFNNDEGSGGFDGAGSYEASSGSSVNMAWALGNPLGWLLAGASVKPNS